MQRIIAPKKCPPKATMTRTIGMSPSGYIYRIRDVRCDGTDGRGVFSTEFERTPVQRILTGEKTLAELSRELDISPSLIRNWKRFAEAGSTTAVQAIQDVIPASHFAGGVRQDPGARAGAG